MVVIVLLFLKQRRGQVVLNLPAHVAPCNLLNRRSTFLPVNGYWQATSVKHYHSGHWPHPDSTRAHGHPGSAWGGATWQNTPLRVWQSKKNAEMKKNNKKKTAWGKTIHIVTEPHFSSIPNKSEMINKWASKFGIFYELIRSCCVENFT